MLLDKHGLIHGAGDKAQEFCIQQAVNRVINKDLYGQYSDNPGWDCLNAEIRAFGVRMNDCSRHMARKERPLALKRFAIAELGSSNVSSRDFFEKMTERLDLIEGVDVVDHYIGSRDQELTQFKRLKKLADTAADVLKELGTEGSQFLHLLDEPNKKTQFKEACKLGDKMYAARMADFGMTSCAVKPKQQH